MSDKTFCETFDIPAFDWNKALNEAERLQSGCRLDQNEFDDLRSRSDDWVTCACGNQCAIIPRQDTGQPRDVQLMLLGVSFAESVAIRDWAQAKLTLEQIEARSAVLIAEELSKLNA